MATDPLTRRGVLQASTIAGTGILIAGMSGLLRAEDKDKDADKKKGEAPEEEVSPPEDLMREHGVLKRVMLFGQDGFEKMVDKVAGIEKTLGIYDLAQFTPKV